jgi:HAMP domain-containing protein
MAASRPLNASWITSQYSRRIGAALAGTLVATVGLGALFAVHAANAAGAGLSGIAGTLFVVVLNLGLLGIVLGGNVAVELRRLTDAAAAIEDGELDTSPDIDRADEFGRLASAFDSMADRWPTLSTSPRRLVARPKRPARTRKTPARK